VDRAVDPQTGTLRADLTFPNPKRILRPGLYGKLRYREEVRKDALLVPNGRFRSCRASSRSWW